MAVGTVGKVEAEANPPLSRVRNTMNKGRILASILVLALAACSGGDAERDPADGPGIDEGSDAEGFEAGSDTSDQEGFEEAFGTSGGGGTLIFDGVEIPIASAMCIISGDSIEVGTISDSGHRVLVSTNGRNPIDAQILDPGFLQWFPQGTQGGDDEAVRDGNTFKSDTTPYFNNADDRVVEASFTIECP
jgi:hypothetical protein